MTPLVSATLAFVLSHFLLSSGPVRRRLAGALGEGAFSGVYSVVALILIAWMVREFGRAPVMPLWALPWAPLVPVLVIPAALLLLVCSFSQSNPTMVGGTFDQGADPAPGILRITRHPMLWAFTLWGLAHIVPNGDVASLIFFGGFALLALVGMVVIDSKRRARDPDGYAPFAAATSRIPFAAVLAGRARIDWRGIGWWRVGLAAALYVALWLGHPYFAGAPIAPLQ